jgi:CheY-like chemotaxis protein
MTTARDDHTPRNVNGNGFMIHILVVDDHEEDRELLRILLELNGFRVTVAGDGVEALAAARNDRPDAIVSDIAMPRLDGYVLCHTWMHDADLSAIPFIFYTAKLTLPEDERVALALGAARYLIKPMKAEAFLQELRTVLQQRTGHPQPPT